MLGLVYRIRDLESGDKDVSLPLSSEQLADAVEDLGVDLGSSAIVLSAHLHLQASVVQVDGELRGQLVLPCQRCLEPATVPIEMRLHKIYTAAPEPNESKGSDAAVDDEDIDYAHHDGETVDLWPVLREDLILAVPITVLCQEGCRGLCPSCGIDRNRASCDCQPEHTESPLAALRSIKLPT
jgi:uncharacterized protein